MISQKELVPKRRFKGFNNEWRKLKFIEIVFRLSEKNKEEELPRVEFEDIKSGLGTLNKDIYKKKSNKTGVKFNSGDILFGKLRPYLKNWLLADFNGIAVGDFWVFRANDSNSELIYALIQGKKYQQIANLSIGTKMPRSDWEIVSNTKFALPVSNEEQKKIGQFFKHLDEMITLEQRKIDKTKALKSAYLAEMFPAEGERVPKRRFAGFTAEWEEQKLSSLSDVRDGTHDSPKYYSEGHPFITSKNVKNGMVNYDDVQYISDTDYQKINKRSKVDKNDILMGMIGTIGNIALITETPNFAIKNVALIKDTGSVFYLYLYHYFESPNIKKQLFDDMDGGTQKFISLNRIRNLLIEIPEVEEQKVIAHFFEKLDDIITNNQSKLEKLKESKQAYLNEMFV